MTTLPTTEEWMRKLLVDCSKRWLGQRSQQASIAACAYFITTCVELGIDDAFAISQQQVDTFRIGMEHRCLSASTINTRLVAVKAFVDYLADSATGEDCHELAASLKELRFGYKTRTKRSKWHMTDDQWELVQRVLPDVCLNSREADLLRDYIIWTLETGLRVEETLRLTHGDFEYLQTDRPAVIVPGTKNDSAKVRIPISDKAAGIITRRLSGLNPSSPRLFDISYDRLGRTVWNRLREAMGVHNDPTSTLKALRRNFAVNALRKGLPARIIQELMRHSNIETTWGYLRVIGMSDNDETRALLNRALGGVHNATGMHYSGKQADAVNAKVPGSLLAGSPLEVYDSLSLQAELARRSIAAGASDGQV